MRTIRRSASPLDHLSETARAFLAQRTREATGLGLIATAGGLTAALATWSVADPSLNHATDAPVRNLLGAPGAIAADLAMQLFGLGALALLTPIVLWGWRLLRGPPLGRLPLRLSLWVVGAGAATAVAIALPPTARWPLPTGLGGVAGDALLRAAKALTGLSGGAGSALLAFAFAGVAILATTAACGFAFADEAAAGASPRRAGRPDREDSEDALRDGQPGWGLVSLGSIAHLSRSLKSAVVRRIEAQRAARSLPQAGLALAGSGDGRQDARPARREPAFDASAFAPAPAPRPAPAPAPAFAPATNPVVHDEDEDEIL